MEERERKLKAKQEALEEVLRSTLTAQDCDYFGWLGLDARKVSPKLIQKQYRQRASVIHPDSYKRDGININDETHEQIKDAMERLE